ncbi:MAG: DoxX family protein [Pyrinomonadaceae bacterium]
MELNELVLNLPALFGALMIAILFLQSGLDKVFDWRGNREWLTGHFAETFMAPMVPLLLAVITVMELATGAAAAVGLIYFVVTGSTLIIFYSAALGAASLASLFFGQRVAKDYAGAAVIVPYFLLTMAVIYLTNPVR